jgi:hypothetical protein
LTALTFTGPIRSNPKLRAETRASGLPEVENPNGNSGLSSRCNTSAQHLRQKRQIVAPCCSVLQRVALCCTQKFSSLRDPGAFFLGNPEVHLQERFAVRFSSDSDCLTSLPNPQ